VKLDELLPRWDARERHRRVLSAPPDAVWSALWRADLAGGWAVRILMGLRALPALLADPESVRRAPPVIRLEDVIAFGFGRLAEDPGREVVLGIEGRFWRLTGNLEPFERERFEAPIAAGRARAAWNFSVAPGTDGGTRLTTETRVLCGDAASRRKFRLYWFFVRPGSGWIRRRMLAAVARECGRTMRSGPSARAGSAP
jgi:hypothetical protein